MGIGLIELDTTGILSVEDYIDAYNNGICKDQLEILSTSLIYNLSYGIFSNYENLKYISLPNLSTVSAYLFYGCSSLIDVYIPNVSSIGSSAFESCINLANISLDNCISIEWRAFSGGETLEKIYAPKLSYLYAYAFNNCYNMSIFSAPNVTYLGTSIFANCSNLQVLSFPSVTNLYDNPIGDGCTKLKSVIFNNVSIIQSRQAYYYIGNYKLYLPKISNISIFYNNSRSTRITNLVCDGISYINSIASYSFAQNFYVDNLYINNCSYIGSNAFINTNIKRIHASNCISIYNLAFHKCMQLEELYFPKCTYIHSIFRTYSSTTIGGSWQLFSMLNLRSINFPKLISITDEDEGLFMPNRGLINHAKVGPVDYLNFHNIQKVGWGFFGQMEISYDAYIDITNCTDFNFLQNYVIDFNTYASENVFHNIQSLSLPKITSIYLDNTISENNKYFVPPYVNFVASGMIYEDFYAKYAMISITNLYMSNLENLHYDISYNRYSSYKYVSFSTGYEHEDVTFLDFIYSPSSEFIDKFMMSPIHNIKKLYLPKCLSFCINATKMSLNKWLYYSTSTGSIKHHTYRYYNTIEVNDGFPNLEYISIPKCKYLKATFTNSSMNLDFPNVIDGVIDIYYNDASEIILNNNYSGELKILGMQNLSYLNVRKSPKIHLENLPNLSEINFNGVTELNGLELLNICDNYDNNISLIFNNLSYISISFNGVNSQPFKLGGYLGYNNESAGGTGGIYIESISYTNITDFKAPNLSSYETSLYDPATTDRYIDNTFKSILQYITNEVSIPNLSFCRKYKYNDPTSYVDVSFNTNFTTYIYTSTGTSLYSTWQAKYITLGFNSISIHNWSRAISVNLYGSDILLGFSQWYRMGPGYYGTAFSSIIQTINIPHLKRIGALGLAFTDMSYSSYITYSTWSYFTWYENTEITKLSFPELYTISDYGLYKLMNLSILDIPECYSLGKYALYNCPKLSYLYLPNIYNISKYGLPSNIKILKLGSTYIYPHSAYEGSTVDVTTGINSDIEKFIQVPESMYTMYSTNPQWQSVFDDPIYRWNLITY